jgi:subtilisin family serine protease
VSRKLVTGLAILALSACESGQLPTEPGESGSAGVTESSQQVVALAQALQSLAPGDPIPGHYIVRFNEDVTDAPGLARAIAGAFGSTTTYVYSSAIQGFAAALPAPAAEAISRNPQVQYVEQDRVVSAVGIQTSPTWGLDRIDERSLPMDAAYTYDNDGTGVHAYVIDTGIRTTHSEFGGRAFFEIDFIGDGDDQVNNGDCDGHGTHVAGTLGGATYGVAKNVTLHAVRVLGCTASGSTSGVIGGVDWVTANHASPAVANMSLSGFFSSSLNAAVANSVAAGVTYAVAAANQNTDACTRSPASAPEALTVGATDITDTRASFSNFGACLDLFAPGVSILSSYKDSDTDTRSGSGTSMASPHVAGVAALYLAEDNSWSPAQVTAAILTNGTPGVVNSEGLQSPNLLLYSRLTAVEPPPSPSDVHVESITVSSAKSGNRTTGSAEVMVHDDASGVVGAATVWGEWRINGQVRVAVTQGTTDSDGITTVNSGPMTGVKGRDVVEFCVTDVSGVSLEYMPGANIETCDVVGGGDTEPDPEPPPSEGFTLTAKVTRRNRVELTWTGSSASSFDIHGNGQVIATVPASPYVDQDKNSGSWTYMVCEEKSTTACTNEVTVTVK